MHADALTRRPFQYVSAHPGQGVSLTPPPTTTTTTASGGGGGGRQVQPRSVAVIAHTHTWSSIHYTRKYVCQFVCV